jgi:hypothetical protein
MLGRHAAFVRAVSVNPLGRVGVVLTTSSCITFVVLQLAMITGVVTNAYVGLIVYLLFPSLFVVGLILIPFAWWRQLRSSGLTADELLERRFGQDQVQAGLLGSHLMKTVGLLTLGNVIFLGLASAKMLHFMDGPEFCGTACHSVMSPEWTTYQASPHARVACVDCHVGEGLGALVDSKLNGAWQMVSAAFDLYDRPISTPVHQLRPARETCERCHWPDKFYGSRLQTRVEFANDERSTPRYTTLNIKIDAGHAGDSGVHWHVLEGVEVRYASIDDERETMLWVESRRPDGSWRRWRNTAATAVTGETGHVRVMDCVDCHNRATHIYQDPGRAVDAAIHLGEIDRSLPFIRREAVAAITVDYPDREAGLEGIRNAIEGFYRHEYPRQAARWSRQIDQAVAVLHRVYLRNVHHVMNIGWGAYPSLLGHQESDGCFRCHTPTMVADDGEWVTDDCTVCHSILANDEADPFAYLGEADDRAPNRAMHEYLRDEFLSSFVGDERAGRRSH